MKRPTIEPNLSRRLQRWQLGDVTDGDQMVPAEVPVVFEYNCVSFAVMMATPVDLEDFAMGFSLTEGIIDRPNDIIGMHLKTHKEGVIVEMELHKEKFESLESYQRNIAGGSGCGICGKDSIDEVMRPLRSIPVGGTIKAGALQKAYGTLREHQPLNAISNALHGAAFVSHSGDILAVREDVGRHNALDKLIGHVLSADIDHKSGFILMTSRASFELVHKAIAAGFICLATVSAPTATAIDIAEEAGLTLIAMVRDGTAQIYTDTHARFQA